MESDCTIAVRPEGNGEEGNTPSAESDSSLHDLHDLHDLSQKNGFQLGFVNVFMICIMFDR